MDFISMPIPKVCHLMVRCAFFMVLYDPRSMSYVHNNEDICLFSDIDAQILYLLFTLMDYVQPNLHFKHNCCSTSRNRVPQQFAMQVFLLIVLYFYILVKMINIFN